MHWVHSRKKDKNNFLLYLHDLGWSMLLDLDWRSWKLSAST